MLSSAVEHFLHTEGVTGSIPVAPTISLLLACGAAVAQPLPAHVPGTYSRGDDTLRISRDLKVQAKFFFANGHSCTFEGQGIYSRDRVIASDEKNECRLVLFFTEGRVHTVTQGECHQWCGVRGSLDRAILRKKN